MPLSVLSVTSCFFGLKRRDTRSLPHCIEGVPADIHSIIANVNPMTPAKSQPIIGDVALPLAEAEAGVPLTPADARGDRLVASPALGVAMPVFNEERWLDVILERVLGRPEVALIVAVDDGSSDGSWAKLQAWAAKEPRVHVIQHERNRGKGAAIRTALARLTTPLILIQDADLEYDPADYPRLLAPIQRGEAEVVYGSRFANNERAGVSRSVDLSSAGASPYHAGRAGVPPSVNSGTVSPSEISPSRGWHRLGNRMLTWAANRMTGLQLTDEATCYKLFKRDVLQRIELTEEGFGFCPEVTAKVARLIRRGEVRLVEVPITYRGRTRAEGKKIRLRDGWSALQCLWRHTR
ncbi:MAG TPA: hypothetical protein DCY13_24420 [Verrucomicrobiales bacterium]|nr:hypothetical protein [Verrucomicrobiales bacterium]